MNAANLTATGTLKYVGPRPCPLRRDGLGPPGPAGPAGPAARPPPTG
jgi:hypothetical protein